MAQTDSKTVVVSGPVDKIVCVDGEWYHCPGEYPEPCVGPFTSRQGLLDNMAAHAAVRGLSLGDAAARVAATPAAAAGAGAPPVVAS